MKILLLCHAPFSTAKIGCCPYDSEDTVQKEAEEAFHPSSNLSARQQLGSFFSFKTQCSRSLCSRESHVYEVRTTPRKLSIIMRLRNCWFFLKLLVSKHEKRVSRTVAESYHADFLRDPVEGPAALLNNPKPPKQLLSKI